MVNLLFSDQKMPTLYKVREKDEDEKSDYVMLLVCCLVRRKEENSHGSGDI